ncbi:8856_t:CDS:1, partial [Cetraspora pellucida]
MDIDLDNRSEYISEIDPFYLKQTFDTEQVSDVDTQSIVEPLTAGEKSIEKLSVKKIRVNIVNPSKKPSYVWKFFEEENNNDICKIIVLRKGQEEDCGKSYIHTEGTGNMQSHLRSEHGIF